MASTINQYKIKNLVVVFHPLETEYPINNDPKILFSTYNYFDVEYDMVEFNFEYTANDAIGFGWCCFPHCECLGYHLGDSESVYVLFDKVNRYPRHVCYKAHGRGQQKWEPWGSCETDGEELTVYSARASHAFYPHAGTYWRAFIFAPDLCGDSCLFGMGRRISYDVKNLTISGPIIKDIPNSSITYCERCCLCCCMQDIRNKK